MMTLYNKLTRAEGFDRTKQTQRINNNEKIRGSTSFFTEGLEQVVGAKIKEIDALSISSLL